jgi:hypothetical protein
MPRFYFHVHDQKAVFDEEGTVLPDVAAARAEAVTGVRDLMCDQLREGHLNLAYWLEVEDENRCHLFTLPFRAAVEIKFHE